MRPEVPGFTVLFLKAEVREITGGHVCRRGVWRPSHSTGWVPSHLWQRDVVCAHSQMQNFAVDEGSPVFEVTWTLDGAYSAAPIVSFDNKDWGIFTDLLAREAGAAREASNSGVSGHKRNAEDLLG